MGIRNFWVEGHIDGRRTPISGGPQSREGGINLVIKMRDQGEIGNVAMCIEGTEREGTLQLEAWIEHDGVRQEPSIGYTTLRDKRKG